MSSRQLSGDSLQAAAPVPAHNRSPSGSMSGVREDGAAGSPPAASSAETKVRKEYFHSMMELHRFLKLRFREPQIIAPGVVKSSGYPVLFGFFSCKKEGKDFCPFTIKIGQ